MTEKELVLFIEETKGIALAAVKRYLPGELYHLIDDVIQETYLRVYKNSGRIKFISSRGRDNWVYTIAKHETLRIRAAALREDEKIRRFTDSAASGESALDFFEDDINFLRDVISLLPEKYRVVFELLVTGFSEKEVAEKLSIKHGTVKSRIHRGKDLISRNISGSR